MKDLNSMCRDCRHLDRECSGTSCRTFSGCVWKTADPESMAKFTGRHHLDFTRSEKTTEAKA